ncbi:MAG: translocation/assembly module TamB [Chlorobi bacterium]|nr:translocation/assembly module TamB [Chlorobiota bacterium]
MKINYGIFGLLDKNVELTDAVIVNPAINFVRIKNNKGDSVWNFAYLFSSEDTTKDTSEFEWKINVKRLRIENLNFVMLGAKPQELPVSAFSILPEESITTENLKISSFNLETSAQYDKNAVQLWIRHLGFNSNFGFNLNGLSGDFYISKSRAEINKLNIETRKSWVQMDYVFIDKLDLMNVEGLPSFKGKDLRLSLVGKNFNFDDLKSFLPVVTFLDGDLFFELKAKGKFDDIIVEKCRLKTRNTDMGFSGRMVNLVEPEKLWFDVKSSEFKIDPEDTKIYTPGLPIPDYTHVGVVTGHVTYRGEPLDFESTFDVQSSVGNAKGFFNLNLNTSNYRYTAQVETSGLNIGKLLKDQSLESNINGMVEADGSGFDLANVSTTIKYEITDTKLFEQKIDKSAGVLNLKGYNIEADVAYASGSLEAGVKGNINVRDFNNPVYSLKGQVRNLDISDFTKDAVDKSSLTFAFDLNGKGITPEGLEGNYNISLANSFYGKLEFPATPIDLRISTSGSNDYITFTSNLFDFNARGSFNIVQIGDVVMSNITMLQNEISKKFNLDTLLPVQPVQVVSSNMDFTYEFKTKDSDAITKMFFLNDLKFAGDVKGYIKNSPTSFDGKSEVTINNFSYGDTVFVLKNARAEFIQNNDYRVYKNSPKGDFGSFNSVIDFKAGKLGLNSNIYDNVAARLDLADANQSFRVNARQDTTLNASLSGVIDLSKDTVGLDINTLEVSYHRFNIKNPEMIQITYDPSRNERTFDFNKFSLSSSIVNVDLSGRFSLSGGNDFEADFSSIDLPSALQYAYNPKSVYAEKESEKFKTPLKGKIRRISFYVKGMIDDPLLSFEMNTGVIRYDNIRVGTIDAFIDYEKQNLAADVLVRNAGSEGILRLTGNIPFSNPLKTPDSLEYAAMLQKPLDLKLSASDFQINLFSKLIPNFSDIRGFLNGEITATGTIDEPVFAGNATIEKGRFFFSWNGLYYRFESSFRTDKSDLVVERFSVYNDRDRARHIDIWGRVNFAGLSINDIDLYTSGDMYFLDGSSIQNRFGFYGEMLAGIGDPPIRIKGNLTNLLVSGQLKIKSARLYFPAISSMAYDIYADDFTYKILTDGSGDKYLDTIITVSPEELQTLDPFLRYNHILERRETSVADYITYNLDIVLEKNIYVNMNMNSLTREELNAEFQGSLRLDNKTSDKRFQLFGRMDIVGDSYYRFYKNFRINNSFLNFNGDYNDPDLKINAEYKNIRTTNTGPEIMYVILEIKGTRYKPELTLKLRDENGGIQDSPQAQSDAISYLLFGAPMNSSDLGRTAIGSLGRDLGSGLASTLLYEALRNIAPFILNTEVIYTGGDLSGTDIRITSAFGDAIVRFGGKILSNINNLEVSVEYPLNKMFNLNVSNNLLIEISRVYSNSLFNFNQGFETRAGLTYKIRY